MKASVNIKMEEEVRDQAKAVFAKMGLDMTTAVNMFLLTAIREKKIPFEVTSVSETDEEERYEKLFAQKLRRAEEQERKGQMRDFSDFKTEVSGKYGF